LELLPAGGAGHIGVIVVPIAAITRFRRWRNTAWSAGSDPGSRRADRRSTVRASALRF